MFTFSYLARTQQFIQQQQSTLCLQVLVSKALSRLAKMRYLQFQHLLTLIRGLPQYKAQHKNFTCWPADIGMCARVKESARLSVATSGGDFENSWSIFHNGFFLFQKRNAENCCMYWIAATCAILNVYITRDVIVREFLLFFLSEIRNIEYFSSLSIRSVRRGLSPRSVARGAFFDHSKQIFVVFEKKSLYYTWLWKESVKKFFSDNIACVIMSSA